MHGTCSELRSSRRQECVCVSCDFGERYLSNPVYAEQPDPDFSELEDALVPAEPVPV